MVLKNFEIDQFVARIMNQTFLFEKKVSSKFHKLGKFSLLILLALIGSTICVPCTSFAMMDKENKQESKGLYFYSSDDFAHFFGAIGDPEFWKKGAMNISRNSDGTAIRILSRHRNKFVIITYDGSITKLDAPGYPAWLNDENQVVAWHDRNKGIVHYKDRFSEKISTSFNPQSGPDPSGKYFIKSISGLDNASITMSCSTDIYSIESPSRSLAKVNICASQKIFLKNKKIYLFGKDYSSGGSREKKNSTIFLNILQIKGVNNLTLLDSANIKRPRISPAPFYISDFSPWEDEVLLVDGYDPPFRSKLYLYNLKIKIMEKVGKIPYSGGWGFFLHADILKKAIENYKEMGRFDS